MHNKYYYHVTTKDKLPDIMKDGLKPMVGENASAVNEEEPAVYLCRRRDIPYWLVLTNGNTVLKIDRHGLNLPLKSWAYDNYEEYTTDKGIDPKWISRTPFPGRHDRLEAMRDLARSHVYALSYMCFSALRTEWQWLTDNLSEEAEAELINDAKVIAEDITINIGIMSRIDFTAISQQEIAKIVRGHSNNDCYVTFADSYFNKDLNPDIPDAGKRCWQHLANVELPELKDACLKLHKFIKKVIPPYVRRLPGIGGFAM